MSENYGALMELATFVLFLGAVFVGYVALIWLALLTRLARVRQAAYRPPAIAACPSVATDPLAAALARAWPGESEAARLTTLEAA